MTASFRHPLTISGTQLSTPVPAYSNVLGMISACAGRFVQPSETRVGFEFVIESQWIELERTVRFQMDKGGKLRFHSKGQGLGFRQVFGSPTLDLYVTNLNLLHAFERPAATPRFGRSQDVAWIKTVERISLEPVHRGAIGPTLLPYPQPGIPGAILRLPESFECLAAGECRAPGPIGYYQALPSLVRGLRFQVERSDLFHPTDAARQEDAIYLHRWIGG
jgi:CRISPR-associated protein Cas5t